MKILIFSDSHGDLKNMKKAINHFSDIKTLIHLGDFIKDANDIKLIFPHLNIYAISGNNDYENLESEKFIDLEENRFFITHGHKYGVYYGINNLYYKGIENGANIILFGHTHCKFLEKSNDILILNPGSISRPRDCYVPSFSILEIKDYELNAKFFGIFENEIIEIK